MPSIHVARLGSDWLMLLGIAATYVLTPFVIHSLGAEGNGTSTLIAALTGYINLLALGVPMACVRYLAGPYHMLHAALPVLLRSPEAAVVNVSTGAAHAPREGWSAYCSSKAGLAMLTRCVANEYGARGLSSYGLQPDSSTPTCRVASAVRG